MQTIANKGRHVAEWGGYQVSLQVTDISTLLVVRSSASPYEQYVEVTARTPADAIKMAANWLEAKGCTAFVDGKQRSLANFLFFVPSGM